MFRLSILLGNAGTRETELDTVLVKKIVKLFVVKFATMITLELFNFGLKLIIDKSTKVKKLGKKTSDFFRNG